MPSVRLFLPILEDMHIAQCTVHTHSSKFTIVESFALSCSMFPFLHRSKQKDCVI